MSIIHHVYLFITVLSSTIAQAQYLGFQTRGGGVYAPVAKPDGSPPGPEFIAQLFRVMEDGELVPLEPSARFQYDASEPDLRYHVKPVTILVPDIMFPDLFADPIDVTIRMRVWNGADWDHSSWRGESEEAVVTIRNVLFPPANMVELKGFRVEGFPRIATSRFAATGIELRVVSLSGGVTSALVERSTDLLRWESVGTFEAPGGIVTFSEPEASSTARAFYRVSVVE